MNPHALTPARQTLLKAGSLALLCLLATTAAADDYLDARSRLIAAYGDGDHIGMVAAARDALVARPAYPAGLYNLAFAYVTAGEHKLALDVLEQLIALRLDFDIDSNAAFEVLAELSRWQLYIDALESIRGPVGQADRAFVLQDGGFVPEGIAIDGDTLFLGSIRHGDIIRRGSAPAAPSESLLPGGEAGSVFGLRLKDDELWFAAAATPQYAGPAEVAGTGIFRLPLEAEAGPDRWMLPNAERPQSLGDLVFLGADILASDQLDGRIYRLNLESGYEVLLDRGHLKSPQGLVLDKTQHALYVADYVGGLYRLELESGDLSRFEDSPVASYYGIDGLYRSGNWLIAVQNGIRPNRVTAHRLSDDGKRIIESRILLMNHPDFDEPTLGTIANGAFYLVANSHWNRFDQDNELPPDLAGPVILKVDLPGD